MLQGLWGLEFRVPWFNVEVEGFGVGLGGSWVCAFVVFLRGLDGWWAYSCCGCASIPFAVKLNGSSGLHRSFIIRYRVL